MTLDSQSFGPRLKAERERRGITLDAIAETTKINRSLLAALERNDLSQWPKGIFRRAFVRDYASTIGIPVEPVLAALNHQFPDDAIASSDRPAGAERLRLTLAPENAWRVAAHLLRAVAAFLDSSVVLVAGAVVAWAVTGHYWTVTAIVALTYHGLATAVTGRTPALWALNRNRTGRLISHAPQVQTNTRELLHLITRRSESPVESALIDPGRRDSMQKQAASR